MEIVQDRALLFNTRKGSQITALIPKSKVVESYGEVDRVLVHWDFDEVQLLRNLGIKNVPSPILGRYRWPGMYTPFGHQKTTADFLTLHPRCFVFNEAGTGKTSAAAWAADYLMTQGRVKRVLIVCPVSIMETAWRSDLFKTVMHRTVAIAQGTRTQRQAVVSGNYEFVIINFDGVKVVREELTAGGFDLIIVDEANAIKSVQTERWKALASLIRPSTRLWLMTGTPASQSPLDAYGLAKMVNPDAVPRFFGAFRDKVMTKLTQYKWAPRPDAQQIVHAILQPAIRFTKEECLDLPDMLFNTRDVPLTPQQAKYYDALRKQMMTIAAGAEITAVNAASMLNKLLQVSCIKYNTPVLTQLGWMPICNVTPDDYVWDGEEWVHCDGAVFKGMRNTVVLDGVSMTPEHLVLTEGGWLPAQECIDGNASSRTDRTKVRLPDRLGAAWHVHWEDQESDVALPVRLRVEVVRESQSLRSIHRRKTPKSCGCQTGKWNVTHGMAETRAFKIWSGMKRRCANPADKDYKNYGARGITVCKRWAASFENFWADMKAGYADHLTLDRKNVNKGYSKANCRWATAQEQGNNTRVNRILETSKGPMTVAQAARAYGVKPVTLYARLARYGWPLQRALTTPGRRSSTS